MCTASSLAKEQGGNASLELVPLIPLHDSWAHFVPLAGENLSLITYERPSLQVSVVLAINIPQRCLARRCGANYGWWFGLQAYRPSTVQNISGHVRLGTWSALDVA